MNLSVVSHQRDGRTVKVGQRGLLPEVAKSDFIQPITNLQEYLRLLFSVKFGGMASDARLAPL
jgi:hypothetical protein